MGHHCDPKLTFREIDQMVRYMRNIAMYENNLDTNARECFEIQLLAKDLNKRSLSYPTLVLLILMSLW